MKPFYKSKKFWTAIVTAVCTVVAYYKDENLANMLLTLGGVLIGGFALEDHGKAKAAIK